MTKTTKTHQTKPPLKQKFLVISMTKVLQQFVGTIIATGGLIRFANGTCGCAGDEDWLDLADAALLAQEVLNSAGIAVEIPIIDAEETEASK